MSKCDNGGPAFPIPGSEREPERGGMTLRDWFAGQALAGDAANSSDGNYSQSASDAQLLNAAKLFYRIADAMIEARK